MCRCLLDDLIRPDGALYFSDMRLAQVEHTDTGLADTAADCERKIVFQNRLLERKLCTLLTAGELQLTPQRIRIDTDAHGGELQRDVQYRIIDNDICV